MGRRSGKSSAGVDAAERLRLDLENEQLWQGERLVPLRPKPFAVFRFLVEHSDRLVKKEELLTAFWGDAVVKEGVLKTALAEIRRALGDTGEAPRYIATLHRRGYRFIGQIEISPKSSEPRRPGREPRAGTESAFVGRQAELASLRAAVGRVVEHRRQLVFISGEPGIGKSTLVDVFLEQLEHRDSFWVARGQCVDQFGAGEPYMPFFEALSRLSKGPDSASVRGILKRHAPSCAAHLPWLASDASSGSAAGPAPVSSPERMLREMAEAVEALAETRPLLLVLEDLHWADHSTLDLVSYLAQRSGPSALMLVATHRTLPVDAGDPRRRGVSSELRRKAACTDLALPYLTERALSEYLEQRFPRNAFPASLGALLVERTAGNPLFAVKVVDSWLGADLLREVDGQWRLAAELPQLSRHVPASVSQMIEAECDRLSAFERGVLEAASVAGATFSSASVAAGLAADVVQVEEVCNRFGRRRAFLTLDERSAWPDGSQQLRCHFIHALYHQVIYECIGATLQAQLHRRIAERLERGFAGQAANIAAELASHFDRGQDAPRAIRYLSLAGKQAMLRGAGREAARHFTRALQLLERSGDVPERAAQELELQMALGTALSTVRGYADPEVKAAYGRARVLCEVAGRTPHLPSVLLGLGRYYLVRGEYHSAREIGLQLLALRESGADPVSVEADALLGWSCYYQGKFSEGLEHVRRTTGSSVVVEAGRFDPLLQTQESSINCGCFRSMALTVSGYPDQGLRLAEQMLEAARPLQHPLTLAFALHFVTWVHYERGETLAARADAEALEVLCQTQGLPYFLALGSFWRGVACLELGEAETGLQCIVRGGTALDAMGAALARSHLRCALADAYSVLGRQREAQVALDEAFLHVQQHQEHYRESELYRVRGDILARAGGQLPRSEIESQLDLPASPEACYRRAVEVSQRIGARLFELRAQLSLVRLAVTGSEERQRLADLLNQFSEGHDTAALIAARHALHEGSQH